MISIELPDGNTVKGDAGTVDALLEKLAYNPYEILVLRDGELLLSDDLLCDGDQIKLVSIVHGG